MKKVIKKFLSKVIVCIIGIFLATGAVADTNFPSTGGNIGDFGSWATPENLSSITGTLSTDLEQFQPGVTKQLVDNYVPIEVKVGMAFINGMSMVGRILDMSLVRFMTVFILIMFAFWLSLEAYQIISAELDVKKAIPEIVKKGAMIAIWLYIISIGAAQLFMYVMGPIITIGTYLSNIILDGVANYAGAAIPDTCAAIRDYTATHISQNAIIDATAAADLMCVPTRLSGFFYTAVAAGWRWMLAGIGHSTFSFVTGAGFVVIFTYAIWRFTLMALGVVADLFLAIFMLPFTAVAETIGKTNYKGIVGEMFNIFLQVFQTQSLQAQIGKFINAALYFVSLSIVVAVCAALMSGVVTTNLAAEVPSIDNVGFMPTLLTGMLVAYLAVHAGSIAKDIGGNMDESYGKKFGEDIKQLWKLSKNQTQKYWKIYKDSKK